jgi:hypothetical protein
MSQETPKFVTVDHHIRVATGRKIKKVLAELDTHRKKIEQLHDELFTLHQQYLCYPHEWVNECSGLPCNIDVCTKCGATDAY